MILVSCHFLCDSNNNPELSSLAQAVDDDEYMKAPLPPPLVGSVSEVSTDVAPPMVVGLGEHSPPPSEFNDAMLELGNVRYKCRFTSPFRFN